MECGPSFYTTNLPPLLYNYTPRTAAEAAAAIWRLRARPPPSQSLSGKQWLRGLLAAQDTSCLHTVSPCSAQGGSRGPALLVPFVLASKRDIGSNPFPKSMNILCWCCELHPLNPEVNRALRRKAVQTEYRQKTALSKSLFGFK